MSERQLATIQKIVSLHEIPGANNIQVARVLGWDCVVKIGEFKVDEFVIYVEIDSILPEDNPMFEFLRKHNFIVKPLKIRGQVSYGLIIPTSILNDIEIYENLDVSDILKIKKYDPQAEEEENCLSELNESLNNSKFNKIKNFTLRFKLIRQIRSIFYKHKPKETWPMFIKKTNEIRVQNIPRIFEYMKNEKFVVREKLDGQSATYSLAKNYKYKIFGFELCKTYKYIVCSRTVWLKTEDNSSYWDVFRRYNIERVLSELIGDAKNIVLQGEILGPKIQGNKYKCVMNKFYVFNMFIDGKQIPCNKIELLLLKYNINVVPFISDDFILSSIDDCLKFSKGKSQLNPAINREGIVLRNYKNGISFKAINHDFLLKENK